MMIGNGPLKSSMEDLIRRRQIPDVILPGFLNQTEISRAYSAADIFVLPSSYMETWGLVVNEAMNFSLPVVATDMVGCAADLVKDDWNGFVVDHRDVDALKSALGRLVRDAQMRREFGQNSLELISKYSAKSCADDIVAACLAVGRNNNIRAKRALV